MIKADLEFIFEDQIKMGVDKCWFMIVEDSYKIIERYDITKMDDLLYLLDNFIYDGSNGNIPRFVKWTK